jgi:hypothetical protein
MRPGIEMKKEKQPHNRRIIHTRRSIICCSWIGRVSLGAVWSLLTLGLFTQPAYCQRQEFIGRGNSSVSWGVVEVQDVDNKGSPEGRIGDRIFVRVKNFDGWLVEQIGDGNYPKSTTPSEGLINLIKAGLFKSALDARHEAAAEAHQFGGTPADWFQNDNPTVAPNADNRATRIKNFKDTYAVLFQQLQKDYKENPYQGIREAYSYIQTVFDQQVAGLRLKINDYTLDDVAPLSSRINAEQSTGEDSYHVVPFDLDPQLNDDVWQKLRSRVFPWGTVNVTLVTKLTDREHDFPTAVVSADNPQGNELIAPKHFKLYTVDPVTLWAALGVVLFLVFLFISVAFRTDLLRDPTRKLRPDKNFPFSLSRVQMAFWLFIIVSSFLFLFVATQKVTVLNVTCLWLIGIGSGTALGAAIITPSSDPNSANQAAENKKIQAEVADQRSQLRDLEDKAKQGPLDPARQQDLNDLRQKNLPKEYTGFFSLRQMLMDLISDDTEGVAIYRFQMLAWTIALGFVFVFKVATERAIPTFDLATLGLLGISSGTYLGFKLRNDDGTGRK